MELARKVVTHRGKVVRGVRVHARTGRAEREARATRGALGEHANRRPCARQSRARVVGLPTFHSMFDCRREPHLADQHASSTRSALRGFADDKGTRGQLGHVR